MRKLFAVLLTVAFLGSAGLALADVSSAAAATPSAKTGKVCDKTKKDCRGKKDKKACKGKKNCLKDKKAVETPVAGK